MNKKILCMGSINIDLVMYMEHMPLAGETVVTVNTDQTEHTARRFSAWLPPIQCTLSGHQCMLIIQV